MRRLPIVETPEKAHFRIHDSALIIRKKLSASVYDTFLSFAVVRDPYSHAVSHWKYMAQYRSDRIARAFSDMPFEDYLAYRAEKRRVWDRLFVRLPDQSHFLVDEEGRLLVKRILKFESLDDDFGVLASELKLGDIWLEKHNPTKGKPKSASYRSYYTQKSEELVREIYARDFDNFGYPRFLAE